MRSRQSNALPICWHADPCFAMERDARRAKRRRDPRRVPPTSRGLACPRRKRRAWHPRFPAATKDGNPHPHGCERRRAPPCMMGPGPAMMRCDASDAALSKPKTGAVGFGWGTHGRLRRRQRVHDHLRRLRRRPRSRSWPPLSLCRCCAAPQRQAGVPRARARRTRRRTRHAAAGRVQLLHA